MAAYTRFVPNKRWDKRILKSKKLMDTIQQNTLEIQGAMEKEILSSASSSGKRPRSEVLKSNRWFARIVSYENKKNFGSYTKHGTRVPFGAVFMRARNDKLPLTLQKYEKSHGAFQKTLDKYKSTTTRKGSQAIWR